ncbi:hypothetical protein LWE61_08815 [Sphingobium sufflavum]|uniref:hypothetical protein n=1 Tax=Sphingobium sufflavum TaxID=1129547 RepID=UPI001F21A149|nr:hypothetical protein [Sphingobium sufflavum]MCE7796660.1 hypothetical protein [Sphingobium sufflavum]
MGQNRAEAAIMDDGYNSRYRNGGTAGGLLGCLSAVLVGIPLMGGAFVASIIGDCIPEAPCHKAIDWFLMGPAIAITIAVGFGNRWLVNRLVRWWRDRGLHRPDHGG